MLVMIVIPIIVADENYLCMVDGFKLIPFNHFSLDIALQGFDVGIFIRGNHIGKLLINAFVLQELSNYSGDEL
jgi:hypothetical protein